MVDNFKLSSGVLLERLKDLQQFKDQFEQMKRYQEPSALQKSYMPQADFNPLERPQTANVLSKI